MDPYLRSIERSASCALAFFLSTALLVAAEITGSSIRVLIAMHLLLGIICGWMMFSAALARGRQS